MMGFLQADKKATLRQEKIQSMINSEKPQERIIGLFHNLTGSMIGTIGGPMKRFCAEQAYDMFAPDVEEAISAMTDEQVQEWMETTRKVFFQIQDLIQNGFIESPQIVGGSLTELGGGEDGETGNKDS